MFFTRLGKARSSDIRLCTLDVGSKKIRIPVWQKKGTSMARNIVITAGMDGDENAGIESAYELIRYFSQKRTTDGLVIIPIVNIAGFENSVSYNPLDNKYPKYVFPGSSHGTATERLVHWLWTTYISHADMWIDLHGGSLTETIQPFVWMHQTKNKKLNKVALGILSRLPSAYRIFEKPSPGKIAFLAQYSVLSIILESGERGDRSRRDINRHAEWVKKIVATDREAEPYAIGPLYTKVRYIISGHTGLWYPRTIKRPVERAAVLGALQAVDSARIRSVVSPEEGIVLWLKSTLNAKKGEVLGAVAAQPVTY